MQRNRLGSALEKYFQRRAKIYLLVTIIFVMGSLFGALAVNIISPEQQAALTLQLDSFFDGVRPVSTGGLSISAVKTITFSNILRVVGVIWVLGLSLIGSPLILVVVFTRGFILGFTIGFIVKKLGLKGVVMSLAALVPQNLFYIPAIIIMGVAGVAFTLNFLKSWRYRDDGIFPQFLGYTLVALFCTLLMAGGVLVEGYLTPHVITWLQRIWG
ncbi:MAG: stage II sporulation protein M [Firmicutes bacterium]|nr:stage II sporulation protein M [Bacillota bacterium]